MRRNQIDDAIDPKIYHLLSNLRSLRSLHSQRPHLCFFFFPISIVRSTAFTSIASSSLNCLWISFWAEVERRENPVPGSGNLQSLFPSILLGLRTTCCWSCETSKYGSHKFALCLSPHSFEETVGHNNSAAQLPIDLLLACDSVRSQLVLCSRYPFLFLESIVLYLGNQRGFCVLDCHVGTVFPSLHPDRYNSTWCIGFSVFRILILGAMSLTVLLGSTLFQVYGSILDGSFTSETLLSRILRPCWRKHDAETWGDWHKTKVKASFASEVAYCVVCHSNFLGDWAQWHHLVVLMLCCGHLGWKKREPGQRSSGKAVKSRLEHAI